MKRMKKLCAALLAVGMLVGMAGCQSGGNDTPAGSNAPSGGGDDEQITVGVVLKTLSSEYWSYVSAGVRAAEEELGVKVLLEGPPSETSYNEQTNIIETMISAGEVDALAIAPLQADMIVTQLANCTIPVLFVDTDAEYEQKTSFIGTGNEEAVYLGGQYMAEKLPEDGKVVIIGGVAGNPTIEERVNGYKRAMEEAGMEILDIQYAESNAEKALNIMENFLQNFDRIDAVLCVGDEMAMAAQRAAAQAGRDEIMFMGFDGISSGVQAVIDGQLTATVAQSPYNMGYQAVVNAVAAAKGEEVEKRIDTGAQVIDAENAEEYLAELNAMVE